MKVGSNIAKKYNLKVGDDVVAAHGVSESSHSHEKSPYKVTGILEKTYTVYDDVLFTSPESVWNVHEHHDEDDVESFSGEHTEHDENEEHDEHSEHYGEYTALLIKTRNPSAALTLIDDVNKLPGVLAVNPSTVLRSLIESIDTTTVIVYVLCAIIAVMSFIIIYMINSRFTKRYCTYETTRFKKKDNYRNSTYTKCSYKFNSYDIIFCIY